MATQSRTFLITSNLQKRYYTYSRARILRQRVEMEIDDHIPATDPICISHIVAIKLTPKPPILAAKKCFQSRNPFSGEIEKNTCAMVIKVPLSIGEFLN